MIKELLLNVVVCLLIVLKHRQVSQKPSQKKNEWFCIRKPLGKIPQETTELNAWEISARNNKFFFINYDFCNVIIWIFNEDATKTVEISNI